MSKKTYSTEEFNADMAGAADSELTKSLQSSAEPVPAPPSMTKDEASEEDFYLQRYLGGFSDTGYDLPFNDGLTIRPINSHVVEGMRTTDGQPMVITTAGSYEINGVKLSFRYASTLGQSTREAKDDGWLFVTRDGFINWVRFADLFLDSAFNAESGTITKGGGINHATGRSYGEELVLCCRPFPATVAQAKAQAIVSSRNLGKIGDGESDANGAERVMSLASNRGVPAGAVRPIVTSRGGWGQMSRASTKD